MLAEMPPLFPEPYSWTDISNFYANIFSQDTLFEEYTTSAFNYVVLLLDK